MIKKELLSMKKISATKEMQEMVKNDFGEEAQRRYCNGSVERYWIYKRYLYFRAIVQNNLLKVACFRREDIKERRKMADIFRKRRKVADRQDRQSGI